MVEKTIETEETKALKNEIKNSKTLATLYKIMAVFTATFGGFFGVISLENALSSNASDQNVAPFWGGSQRSVTYLVNSQSA
ncbi:MAG: hypothetical protein QXL63_00860 [Candidatus Micrarchaeaceae archaeon]